MRKKSNLENKVRQGEANFRKERKRNLLSSEMSIYCKKHKNRILLCKKNIQRTKKEPLGIRIMIASKK